MDDFINCYGMDDLYDLIMSFESPMNLDIEDFLKHKSILYQNRNPLKTKTYLVLDVSNDHQMELMGYFSLVNSPFEVNDSFSKNYWKKLTKGLTNRKSVSAILIAQFGKNFNDQLMDSISGKNLLGHVIELIANIEHAIGLNLIYLECEDHPKLRQFYESNGFHLNVDKNGNPVKTGKENNLLCYVAKFDDFMIKNS